LLRFGHEPTECGRVFHLLVIIQKLICPFSQPYRSRQSRSLCEGIDWLTCVMERPTLLWLHIHFSAWRKEAHLSPVSLLFFIPSFSLALFVHIQSVSHWKPFIQMSKYAILEDGR